MLTGVHLVGHNKSMRLKWLDHVETMRERERERERERNFKISTPWN